MAGIQDNAGVAAPSAFAQAAANLLAMGFHPIPILPRDKAPGEVTRGEWRLASDWQRFRDRAPTAIELGFFNAWTGANVGVVMGSRVTVASQELQVIGVDIDTDDYDMLQSMERALPRSPVRKRGRKGFTAFYLAAPEFKTRRFAIGPQGAKKVIAEFLTGNATRQTVVPPSLHPETGTAYHYETAATLENTHAETLPIFNEDHCAQFLEALESIGWNAHDAEALPTAREVRGVEGENVFREMNNTALANLEAWVPHLSLLKKNRTSPTHWNALANWVHSNKPMEQRTTNIGIDAAGITYFGAGEGDGGLTALDLIMKSERVDFGRAFEWLGNRLGTLIEAGPMTGPQKAPAAVLLPAHDPETGEIIDQPANLPVMEASRPAISALDDFRLGPQAVVPFNQTGGIPPSLTRVPGLVGDITEWIDATASQPNRGLALTAALAFLSTVYGRHYSSPSDAHTNNYFIVLARTGSGKQHVMTQIKRLAAASGPEILQKIGPANVMSFSAMVSLVTNRPSILLIVDEVADFFGKILARNASSHESQIKTLFLSLFSDANTFWGGVESASKKAVPIHNPNMCFLGTATKENFYGKMGSGEVQSGFLNRMLVFTERRSKEKIEPRKNPIEIPNEIVFSLRQVAAFRGPMIYNASGELPVEPIKCNWGTGAKEVYDKITIELRDYCENRPSIEDFFSRTAEHAIKLATVRAVGENRAEPVIDRDCMEWAKSLALLSAFTMVRDAGDSLGAENQHGENYKRVKKAMRELAPNCLRSKLMKKVCKGMNSRTLSDIISSMREGGEIRIEQKESAKGPAGEMYVLVDDD